MLHIFTQEKTKIWLNLVGKKLEEKQNQIEVQKVVKNSQNENFCESKQWLFCV